MLLGTFRFLISCTKQQAPVVRKVNSAVHWINYYPKDSAIGFRKTYPLDSDLSGGWLRMFKS